MDKKFDNRVDVASNYETDASNVKEAYPHLEDYLDVFKKNELVTWKDLMEICSQIAKFVTECEKTGNESMYKVIDSLKDFTLKLYEESEYRRMRSMRFVLVMTGYTDPSKWYPIYDEYCKEYDKLNRKED